MYDTFLADLWATMPITIVALVGIAAVVIDSFWNDSPIIAISAQAGLLIALIWEVVTLNATGEAFYGMIRFGGFAGYVNIVVLLSALLSVILSVPYLRSIGHNYGEVYGLILFSTVGMMTLGSAANLVMVFVGLETMSICLYVLTGLVRKNVAANESALKYFVLGAFATGFFLYGIALMYGATETMYLNQMAAGLVEADSYIMFWAGVALLLIGILFKVSAVPFHMWTPDAYQGAPTTLTGFMASGSKVATFAALVMILWSAVPVGFDNWVLVLATISVLTMVVGNVMAIAQANVKRMLAYSSVAHVGYVLVGLAAGTADGYAGAMYYLLVYSIMTIGAFGVIAVLEWDGEQGRTQTIESLAGIGFRKPLLGVVMGFFMFSLTGFPPLAGFIGKYRVFAPAIDAGLTWLVVIAVLTSIVSAWYYLRVLVFFWMRSPDESPAEVQRALFPVPTSVAAVLVVSAVALLIMGILPASLIELTQSFFVDASMASLP